MTTLWRYISLIIIIILLLRERIDETCEFAQTELRKIQDENKHNKKSKLSILKPGDKVLVLLLAANNKLLFQWKKIAEVVQRRVFANYKVKFDGGQVKTFHINMLKRYNEREDVSIGQKNKRECQS